MEQFDIYFGSSITQQVSVEERKKIYRILERNSKIRKILPGHINRDDVREWGIRRIAEEKETIFLEELLKQQEVFPDADLTIVLDIPPEERRKRALEKQKSTTPDKFEADLVLQERVNKNYLRLVDRLNSKNTVNVWGVGPKEAVFERIKGWVDRVVN